MFKIYSLQVLLLRSVLDSVELDRLRRRLIQKASE